jgi:hypothetical protein
MKQINSYLKASLIAGLPIVILYTIIFSGYEKGIIGGVTIGLVIGGYSTFLLGFLHSKHYKKTFPDSEDMVDEETVKYYRANYKKTIPEFIYAIIFLIGSFFIFMFIKKHYLINLSEITTLMFFFFFFAFGIAHILASNFIAFTYDLGVINIFPFNHIPLTTPKRSKIFGAICVLISFIILIGFLYF